MYPAIAEQLVFKIDFGNTLRGTVKSIPCLKVVCNDRLVFAAVAFVTLAAANCIVCQRSDPGPDRPEMDWGMLKDVPFLLMTASKYKPPARVGEYSRLSGNTSDDFFTASNAR